MIIGNINGCRRNRLSGEIVVDWVLKNALQTTLNLVI